MQFLTSSAIDFPSFQLRHSFPSLDAVDHKRRRAAPCAFEPFFPRIEAIVMFGEPIRWETSMQLLIDVLVTDGLPAAAPLTFSYPHLPVVACNMDLLWMAEAVMPRFGHGAFLLSLENLYKKITGRDLVYSALIGKPSEITFRHGEHMLQEHARSIGIETPVKNMYCIGDNVCTDIFGANLYNRYIQTRNREEEEGLMKKKRLGTSRCIDHLVGEGVDGGGGSFLEGAENCHSVLVETGVFSADSKASLNHSPRDFLPAEDFYQEPTFVVTNVLEAVNLIFRQENFARIDF